MVIARDGRGGARSNGGVVLMARIVDRAGRAIRRADVAAIGYKIGPIDSRWHEEWVELDIDEVMCDRLICGGRWDLDLFGHNFRHEMELVAEDLASPHDAHFEVRYLLTATSGLVTSLRFQLGAGCAQADSSSVQ